MALMLLSGVDFVLIVVSVGCGVGVGVCTLSFSWFVPTRILCVMVCRVPLPVFRPLLPEAPR